MLSSLLAHGHDIRVLAARGAVPSLGVLAEAVGYEQRRNELYSWDGLKRGSEPFLVIQHTILGEGRLEFGGARYRLGPGQTMLVTMPHAHRYWLERGGHWEYFWFILSGREALRLARDMVAIAGPVLLPGAEGVARLAGAAHTLLTRPALTAAEASVLGYGALAVLHDTAYAGGQGRGLTPSPSPAMARVLAHVEGNLAGDLRVDALALVAGLSRAHFVRRFAAETGLPPSDHVFARRMDRVERLLTASEMKIADIARATGFAEANYLAKAFRRHRGLSPMEFRALRDEAV